MPTTYLFSGLQPFWNYDSFSISPRQIGGGTGYINTAGAKWSVTDSGDYTDPEDPPTVEVDEGMNFMFSMTDVALKFHNNSPVLTRFYNSTERLHTGTGNSCDSLPRHMGLFGRHMIANYERILIHPATAGQNATEVDGTGARNTWVYSSVTGTTESFTSPDGIQRTLTRDTSEDAFYMVTPDYTTFCFKKHDYDTVPGSGSPDYYYYRLEYIECKNGTRVYIEWEEKDTGVDSISRYRINQISVSTDQGNKKTWVLRFRYTNYSYDSDAFHLVRTMQDKTGREWRYEYDDDGRLIKVSYPDGCNVQFDYTLVGSEDVDNYLMTGITDRKGSTWEVSYSSAYWRIDNDSSSSTDYHTTSYAWSVVDAFTLPSGFLPGGSIYTEGGTYRTVKCVKTDAESKTWDFHHNCHHGPGQIGNLMMRDNPLDNQWKYHWDDPASEGSNDNMLYLTALPLVATNADTVQRTEYTATGNGFKLVTKTYPMRGSNPDYGVKGSEEDAQYVQYSYTSGESTVSKIEYHKDYSNSYFFSETDHTYDANHNLIKTVTAINPDPSPGDNRVEESLELTTYMRYDGFGNVILTTDARGNSSSYYYDQWGAMVRSANQLGSVTKQEWDQTRTRLVSTTDAAGNTTQYSYDVLGQMIATRDAQGNVSKTQYDKNGNVIGRADPRGHSGQMVYDKKNRLIKTVSPTGVVRELTLAKTGQVYLETTTYWDEDYSTNEQVIYRRTFYDDAWKVTSRSLPSDTDHGSNSSTWETNNKLAVKYTYDTNGNVLTTVDRFGQTTTNTYDWANRRETTQPPNIPDINAGEVIRTTYKTVYDGPMGRVSEEQIKEERSTGGQTGWTDVRNYYAVKTYTYDRAGRTIIVQLPDHSLLGIDYYAYQDTYYDANGNVTQRQLRQVNQLDSQDVTTWPTYMEYDIANRVVKESKLVSTDSDTYDRIESTYEYDYAGRRISTNRGGLVIQVQRDTLGQVTEVAQGSCSSCGGGAPAPTAATASSAADMRTVRRYEYDENGNRTKYADSAGVFASVTYDAENRPVATSDRGGRVTRRRYWPTGQLKQEIRPDGNFTGYEYDIEGRATKIWASVPEENSGQAAGPFGESENCALVKTIEYCTGTTMPLGTGENISWTGTTVTAGDYVTGVRTYTYKDTGPVYYDMVYTSNARGQSEKTYFIDSDDSTTRSTTRYYTWRDKIRQIIHPDTNTLDYTWDDHLRLTKEELQSTDEYYEYQYCLCGAVKQHRYHYIDSESNAQDMDWLDTTDLAGRLTKEYYPYTIGLHDSDEYHSILFEYDTASRRKLYSDPTFGHECADTGGWIDNTEPVDEDDWTFETPLRYRYAQQGNLSAMGRVSGSEVRAGEGEPYFVERGADGRIERVIYPDAGTGDSSKPEYEYRYKYAPDGRVSEVALVYSFDSYKTEYGPEKYVIQFLYDDAGRLVRKVVRDNSRQDSTVRYETSYEFDGMGRMTRERIMSWDNTNEKMVVMQDKRTTYDLGGNPTEIKFYDNAGWAYTETRTYARGYQLTDFSTSEAGDVTINTAGSYTYDTNNNLTGTKKFDASRSGAQLSYRAQWEFTFDNKNRLKTHENVSAADNVRGNIWYDGKGRVWQRWNDSSSTPEWDPTLKRFVYDGATLVQEHTVAASVPVDEWVYTYVDINRDYLRHPAGLRQREGTASSNTDYFLQTDQAALEYKIERDPTSATADRTERSASLDQIAGASFTADLSNLATSGDYIEMYGDSSNGFDALVQKGGRAFLTGISRFSSREGNNAYGDRLYHCSCSGCRDQLLNACIYPSITIGMMDICGCAEGYGPFPCHIYYDACLAEGRDYTCNQLLCSPKCGMNPCCPEWDDGGSLGGDEHWGNSCEGDLRAEKASREFETESWTHMQQLRNNWSWWGQASFCICSCYVAYGGYFGPMIGFAATMAALACNKAREISNQVKEDWRGGEGTIRDAMRHCILSCRLYKEPLTAPCASGILNSHEIFAHNSSPLHCIMDHINNYHGWLCSFHLYDTCTGCCDNKARNGELYIIETGKEEVSE